MILYKYLYALWDVIKLKYIIMVKEWSLSNDGSIYAFMVVVTRLKISLLLSFNLSLYFFYIYDILNFIFFMFFTFTILGDKNLIIFKLKWKKKSIQRKYIGTNTSNWHTLFGTNWLMYNFCRLVNYMFAIMYMLNVWLVPQDVVNTMASNNWLPIINERRIHISDDNLKSCKELGRTWLDFGIWGQGMLWQATIQVDNGLNIAWIIKHCFHKYNILTIAIALDYGVPPFVHLS